jgi:hypothetical protein
MGYAGARIEYTIRTTACLQCGSKIGAPRRFGPAQVRCGQCGTTLQTGLTEWANLSPPRKILLAAIEIISPSWLGTSGFTGIVAGLLTQLFLCAIAPIPLYIPIVLLNLESTIWGMLTIGVGQFLYPLVLVVRLVRMVRESQAYTRTQEPPVWGKAAEKEAAAITVGNRYLGWKYQAVLRLLALIIAAVWVQGFSEAIWGITRGYIVLGVAHVGGALVAFELSRCLGLTKGAYTVAILALLATPLTLPILAILRHRTKGLIETARKNLWLIEKGRASSTEITVYHEAQKALAKERNPTAVRPLIQALKYRGNRSLRVTIASTLGEIGDPRATDSLIQALQDKDSNVRAAAATALGKIGDPRAAAPLEEALKDQDADVESAATKALELERRKAK